MYENGEDSKQMLIEDSIGRKILDAAIEIINEEGYENLTIRKVAKMSGCSNSAIYMRFEDKDALARAVAALYAKPFLRLMDDNYKEEDSFIQNMNRIAKAEYDRIQEMDSESVHLQMVYRGSLPQNENPFLLRLAGYLENAAATGEIRTGDYLEMAYVLAGSFWGVAYMLKSDQNMEQEMAYRILDTQNRMMLHGLEIEHNENNFWNILRSKGVDVDKALERMKGNKDAYKSFLVEFFDDPDFAALRESLGEINTSDAFEYAHGLKGMAANLGLDAVYQPLSKLVEILRQGSMEGAMDAYKQVCDACKVVTALL